jgi:hypothetical protein
MVQNLKDRLAEKRDHAGDFPAKRREIATPDYPPCLQCGDPAIRGVYCLSCTEKRRATGIFKKAPSIVEFADDESDTDRTQSDTSDKFQPVPHHIYLEQKRSEAIAQASRPAPAPPREERPTAAIVSASDVRPAPQEPRTFRNQPAAIAQEVDLRRVDSLPDVGEKTEQINGVQVRTIWYPAISLERASVVVEAVRPATIAIGGGSDGTAKIKAHEINITVAMIRNQETWCRSGRG